jgi:hypothetical protein
VAWFTVIGLVFLAIGGYRLGVTCDNTKATIRGYLGTRVIEKERLTGITDPCCQMDDSHGAQAMDADHGIPDEPEGDHKDPTFEGAQHHEAAAVGEVLAVRRLAQSGVG